MADSAQARRAALLRGGSSPLGDGDWLLSEGIKLDANSPSRSGVYQPACPSRPAAPNVAQVVSNASTISARSTSVRSEASTLARIGAFVALTKPRIIELLLVTTVPTMVVAARGWPSSGLVVATLIGGTLSAGGANAANMYLDRDIDALMHRTSRRPLVTGAVSAPAAVIFAASLEAAAFLTLWLAVNMLAAVLALSAALFYVFVYTAFLKRMSPQNIVIGGAAGAVPPLVGWAAVAHGVGAPARGLFALIFLWTPPHFWALALGASADYERANVPMLPNVHGARRTKIEIFAYTLVLVAVSLALTPLGIMGLWYFVPAAILGAIFIWDAWKVLRGPTVPFARMLFKYSLVYLALMCAAMVLDRVLR